MKRIVVACVLVGIIIASISIRCKYSIQKEANSNSKQEEIHSDPVIVPYIGKTVAEAKNLLNYSQAHREAVRATKNENLIEYKDNAENDERGAVNGSDGDSGANVGSDNGESGNAFEGFDGTSEESGIIDGQSGECVEGNSETSMRRLGEWRITFYCPCEICCGQWANGITSSGTVATPWWTVACDGLADGTKIYIDGLGTFEVQDSGVPYGCIDIFVSDHSEAEQWGMMWRNVYVVE